MACGKDKIVEKDLHNPSDLEIALLSRKNLFGHNTTIENCFFVQRLNFASQVLQPTLGSQAENLSRNKQEYGIEIELSRA